MLILHESVMAFIVACRGHPAVLDAEQGTFGIDEVPYETSMTCSWKIRVATTKVSSIKSTLLSNFGCKYRTHIITLILRLNHAKM